MLKEMAMMQGFGAFDWSIYRMGEMPPHKMQDSLGNALLVSHGSDFVGFHIFVPLHLATPLSFPN